jgi:formylglycine-generating enzyme required for sulfatase activity
VWIGARHSLQQGQKKTADQITPWQNERRCLNPGVGKTEQFKDCPPCPEMVVNPSGTFTMGSPQIKQQQDD